MSYDEQYITSACNDHHLKNQAKCRVFSFKSRTTDVQWKTGLLCVVCVYKAKITISRR